MTQALHRLVNNPLENRALPVGVFFGEMVEKITSADHMGYVEVKVHSSGKIVSVPEKHVKPIPLLEAMALAAAKTPYNWREHWHVTTRRHFKIDWVAQLPDGSLATRMEDTAELDFCSADGISIRCSDRLDLVKLEKKRNWSKMADVPEDAIRIRHKDNQVFYGCILYSKHDDGICIINAAGEPQIMAWTMLREWLWLSGKTWQWNPCVVIE